MNGRIKAHYHWVIVVLALVEMAVIGGHINNISSLYLLPVTEAFGISRGTYAMLLSIRSLTAMASTALSGALLHRFGYRKMITASLLLEALGTLLLALSPGLFSFGIGMFILGSGDGVCFTAGVSRLIGDWFHRYHGAVLGVVTAFTGFGGSAFCVLYNAIIEKIGFRASYGTAAVLLTATALVMALLVRDRPDQLQLQPYGEGQLTGRNKRKPGTRWPGFGLGELLRKPAFYLLAAGTFLSCLSLYFLFHSLVPHLRDQGFTQSQAALLQSTMLLLLAVSKFLNGFLCDKIGARRTTILCLLCTCLGMWGIARVHTVAGALAAVLIYDLGLPLTSLTVPLLTEELFGYRAHDSAAGILLSVVALGNLVATPIMNLVYDAIGSYSPVLRAGAVTSLVLVGLYELLYRMANREKTACLSAERM